MAAVSKNRGSAFNNKKIMEAITGYLFLAPAMIVFIMFLIIPIGVAFYLSFTDWNGITPLNQTAEPATGATTLTNISADTVEVPAGTLLSTGGDEPTEYRTTAAVSIPAGESVTVAVESVMAERDANVRARQLDTVVDETLAAN